jgi:DNA-binding response OmpR family regulator
MSELLLVDDDAVLQRMLKNLLEKEGHSVRTAGDAETALLELRTKVPHLMVLDVRLPGMSGFDLCLKMRAEPAFSGLPVIFLTSKGEEANRVLGLEIGGDDYVVKPFSPAELLARIKVALRRRGGTDGGEVLKSGSLTVHTGERIATLDGKALALTPREFELLAYFLAKKRRALSRALITEDVWKQDYTGSTRTVDTHVQRLRSRLGALKGCVQTVENLGYRWVDPE